MVISNTASGASAEVLCEPGTAAMLSVSVLTLVMLVLWYRARLMTVELDWAERYASLETDRDEWKARTVEAQQELHEGRWQ